MQPHEYRALDSRLRAYAKQLNLRQWRTRKLTDLADEVSGLGRWPTFGLKYEVQYNSKTKEFTTVRDQVQAWLRRTGRM